MAHLYKPEADEFEEIFPAKGKHFTLKELHEIVSYDFTISYFAQQHGTTCIIYDDLGLNKNLPKNPAATKVCEKFGLNMAPCGILGPVLIAFDGEIV